MFGLLATLLAASPFSADSVAPVRDRPAVPQLTRRGLRAGFDIGGMLGAAWYVPAGRKQLESALENAHRSFFGRASLGPEALLSFTPVAGAWSLAARDSVERREQVLLVTAGLLQLAGLGLGFWQLASDNDETRVEGPLLSLSPIAGGRLGLSITLSGF